MELPRLLKEGLGEGADAVDFTLERGIAGGATAIQALRATPTIRRNAGSTNADRICGHVSALTALNNGGPDR